jgi:hypothetical protein
MERDQETTNDSAGRLRKGWLLVMLSLFLTGLNAAKPLTVDDSVYYLLVAHIAEHPLDPYGFYAWDVQPANTILAPPVFLYWWALGVRLFGREPVLWKLWLLPFSLLLVFCLHALGRRFARGMEMPFVFFLVLSSAVLPCLNLMLDLPVLALSLLAILMFLQACATGSLVLTLATGIVAGIATQTKYTAFVAIGVMMLHALQTGQWRRWAVVAGMASLMFVGWELLILGRYGDSHFWLGFNYFQPSTGGKLKLIQPLAGYLGSTMAAAIPLFLAALGRSTRVVWGSAALVLAGFALVALVPFSVFAALGDAVHLRGWPTLNSVVFGLFGLAVIGSFAAIARRLLREPRGAEGLPARGWLFSIDGFLVLWLALEIAGYFVLSPYPAARRIIGLVVPGLLLTFRLAARTDGSGSAGASPSRTIWGMVGFSLLLGLLSFVVDRSGYQGQKTATQELAGECHRKAPTAKVWFFGNGAFEFYGEPLGMKRLIADQTPVAPGDWVLVVQEFEEYYSRHPVASRCVLEGVREWDSVLPLRSQYQVGGVALARREESLVRVTVYRAW